MNGVSSPRRANGQSGLRTAGMALVELIMLYAAIKAQDFQRKQSVSSLTECCSAV